MENSSAKSHQKQLLITIFVLIPIAYFLRLNSYQLIFEEPRRALVALEMLLAENWIVPTTNAELYYNKPPLYNWILIGFLKLFGKAEWVVRLPSILSLFLTALFHYKLSKGYIGKQAALLSALFYLTSADILFYFSLLGEIDLFYALIVYLQAMLIFHFYQQKKWYSLYISSYLLTAAGVLTKGIPSLFFQAITLLLIIILNKDFKRLFTIKHLIGISILFFFVGGYFYLYSGYHDVGPYLARLFTETFSRTGIESSLSDNLRHFANFPVQLIKISTPWVILFLLTKKTKWKNIIHEQAFLKFSLWFCLANGILYFLSPGTRERYLYMFFPFIYSLLAFALLQNCEINRERWTRTFYHFVSITTGAGLTGMAIFGIIRNDSWIYIIPCFALAIIVISGLYFLKFSSIKEWIMAIIIVVLMARIGFDLIILPTKKEHDPYKTDAIKMSEIIGNEDIYLIGEPDFKVDEVKFAGIHFTRYEREEPTYLAFQSSFYLSRYTGKILKYTKHSERDGFYISREPNANQKAESILSKKESIKVYYRFSNRLNKEDYRYILYKYIR